MASFYITRPAPFGAVSIHRIITAIDNFRTSVSTWNAMRITSIELNKLSERELTDIGLCRGDINALTAPHARRF